MTSQSLHNKNKIVEPYNSPEIDDDSLVIRRISKHYLEPIKGGKHRLSSRAFAPSSGGSKGMSVDLEQLMIKDKIDPRQYVATPEYFVSVCFKVKNLRGIDLKVGCEPIAANPYHGEVWGTKSKSKRKKLLKLAQFYVNDYAIILSK